MLVTIFILLIVLLYFCWSTMRAVLALCADLQRVRISLVELKEFIRVENGNLEYKVTKELDELPFSLWHVAQTLGASAPWEKK